MRCGEEYYREHGGGGEKPLQDRIKSSTLGAVQKFRGTIKKAGYPSLRFRHFCFFLPDSCDVAVDIRRLICRCSKEAQLGRNLVFPVCDKKHWPLQTPSVGLEGGLLISD